MESPPHFKHEILDTYLAKGWFRMLDYMFTTPLIELEGQVLMVYWLRFRVADIKMGRKQKDLINRNKNFTIAFKPLYINAELEALFALYKKIKPFVGYYSLAEAFRTNGPIFDTWVAEIRDEHNLLIAAGIFDRGTDSIAGIMNFYHPDFERHSLGKMLMLAKIHYCRENGIAWYYPGYITSVPSRFNYKLFPGKEAAEVYEFNSHIWVSYRIWRGNITEDPQ